LDLGLGGMKPREAKKSSMTLCEPTVGLARRRRNLQLQSVRSCIALDFVVLVLSETVLVLVIESR
jgi:hypothetical protein